VVLMAVLSAKKQSFMKNHHRNIKELQFVDVQEQLLKTLTKYILFLHAAKLPSALPTNVKPQTNNHKCKLANPDL
jgi:hypothetical protein